MWKCIAAAAAGGAIGTVGGAFLGRHLVRKEFDANVGKAIGKELESCGFDKEAIEAANAAAVAKLAENEAAVGCHITVFNHY